MSFCTITSVQITASGKWRNMDAPWVVFDDHVKEGDHECGECYCSFCGSPSIYTVHKATNNTTNQEAGHKYCKECLLTDYSSDGKKR